MAQVILIHDNKNIEDLITLNLKNHFGVEVIPRKNVIDTINLLEILPKIDLIILKSRIGDEKTAEALNEYIALNDLNIDLIVLGKNTVDFKNNTPVVENEKDWKSVVLHAGQFLGFPIKSKLNLDFVPINIDYLKILESSNSDIYFRIKQGDDKFQYIKRLHAGDSFTKEEYQRYKSQGLKYFYIPFENKEIFTTFLSNSLVEKLEESNLEINQKIDLIAQGFEIAQREILNLGFTNSTLQMTDTIIDSMVNVVEETTEVSNLLMKILNSKTSFMYQLSHLTCLVSFHIMNQLSDTENNDEMKIQFAYATFFKDIALIDKEELSRPTSFDELDQLKLDETNWNKCFSHALEAAIFIRKNSNAPIDVDTIIKQHHGTLNGKGFSNQNYDKLLPQSRLFIVAESFAREVLKYKESGGSPSPVVSLLKEKFKNSQSMLKIVKDLSEVLKKTNKKKNNKIE